MYPWKRVGCKEKCDRKWLIGNPPVRIAKHYFNCTVKVLSISFSLIFAAAAGSKNNKRSGEGQSHLDHNDIMCIINTSLKT